MRRTPHTAHPRAKPIARTVLTDAERDHLMRVRAAARGRAHKFTVSFRRAYYRITDAEARRLARWEELEGALVRLLKDVEQRGYNRTDRKRGREVLELLTDHLGDAP